VSDSDRRRRLCEYTGRTLHHTAEWHRKVRAKPTAVAIAHRSKSDRRAGGGIKQVTF